MAFVTDPDDLDRSQILFNPKSGQETIAIRGLGAEVSLSNAPATAGTTLNQATDNFSDAGATFTADGVATGDILVVLKQNASDTNVINFYEVQAIGTNTATELDVLAWNPATQAFDLNPTASTASDLYYKIYDPTDADAGTANPSVADGVSMQALYSFCKEEWRTLSDANMDDLIKFVFPFESITREQFELGGATHSDWTFNGDYSRNLIRTGGWEELNVGGTTLARYSGIITLGSLDSDAQVYYQQHDADTDPLNFVLTDAVNQAINVYDLVSLADTVTGYAITGNNTITRNDGGNWTDDGYKVGGQITIIDSENSGENDGTFTIASVADAVDGALTVTGTPLTNNAADTTLQAAVDKRSFLKLFVRKKARTYAGSQISDIGVSTLETIVNRFPLAQSTDAAITLQDGQLGGYDAGGAVGLSPVYQNVESHTTGTDGATSVESASGTFTLTSAGSTFNDGSLRAGDTLYISDVGSADVGYYEIVSVDSATVLTCFVEPAGLTGQANVPFTGGESALDFTVYTGTRDEGSAAGTLSYTAGASTLNLNDGTRSFNADGGLGAREVQDGDMVLVTVTNGDTDAIGVYKVGTGGVAVNDLTLDATDIKNNITTTIVGDTVTYVVLRPGMHLQYLKVNGTTATAGAGGVTNITFNGNSTFTIVGDVGGTADNWVDDYNVVVGGLVTLSNVATANQGANSGQFIVTAITTTTQTNDTLTVMELDTSAITFNSDVDTDASVASEYGFLRELNNPTASANSFYSFNWRMYGNGGSLQDCFQWIQRELRRATDINDANTTFRGDVNDLLMSFSTPTATTFNMYIDDLLGTDSNNITSRDITGENRNFAFVAGLTVNWNTNFQESTDSSRKIVVFFTNPDVNNGDTAGNEFGTAGAIIVQDTSSVDMTVSGAEATAGLSKTFQFGFDTNTQGGRDGTVPAEVSGGTGVTVVAIDTEKAQYNLVTGTINRQNSNIITLAPALERNYSNPA